MAVTVLNEGFKSTGAISINRFVTQVGAETVKQSDAAGQRAIGVSNTAVSAAEATAGKAIKVATLGVAWVTASEAIAIGDLISTTTVGKAQVAAATEVVLGVARSAAAADGDLVQVFLGAGPVA